jgi:hypothetical protein
MLASLLAGSVLRVEDIPWWTLVPFCLVLVIGLTLAAMWALNDRSSSGEK